MGTVAKSIVERGQMYTPDAQLYARAHSMLGTCTSIKGGGVKLVLWVQTSQRDVFKLIYFDTFRVTHCA